MIAASLLLMLACTKEKNIEKQSPNVLYILTDNQSYYELSCNGHSKVKTPNIDKFAAEGVVFDNFFATPYCSPSRAEMQTGRYALRYGIHTTLAGVSNLAPSEKLVSDYLKEKGYKTGVFGKWHLGNEYPYNPVYRGFDVSYIHDGGGIGQLPDYYGNSHNNAVYNNNGEFVQSQGFSSDVLFAEAQKFIEQNKNEPFYCFVSTPATHSPWQAHPEKLKELEARGVQGNKNEMALFSMIENIDDNIGSLLTYLEEAELSENTLVIIATDQGMKYRGLDNIPEEKLFGCRAEVFDYRHKVFCMMQYPKNVAEPYKNTALTGLVDIAPTILDVCGIEPPDNMDGRSLLPLMNNETDWEGDRVLIVQCPRQKTREKYLNASVKTKRWRLVDGKLLFDAINDPYQLVDVASVFPAVVDSLNRVHEEFWNSLDSEENLRLYNYIGANEHPETRLNAMDWYKGEAPWTPSEIGKKDINGTWALKVVKSGKYKFELYHFPREANQPTGAKSAKIVIGDIALEKEIDPDNNYAMFEIELEKGNYDLTTFFGKEPKLLEEESWGAKFVHVEGIEMN